MFLEVTITPEYNSFRCYIHKSNKLKSRKMYFPRNNHSTNRKLIASHHSDVTSSTRDIQRALLSFRIFYANHFPPPFFFWVIGLDNFFIIFFFVHLLIFAPNYLRLSNEYESLRPPVENFIGPEFRFVTSPIASHDKKKIVQKKSKEN